MISRKQMLKTLKEAEKSWEKTYLPKSMVSDIIFLLEDKDRAKKQGKITALPVPEEGAAPDDAQS